MIKLVLAVVAGLLVLPDFARGDDIVVTTTSDGNDGNCLVDCTLREAVIDAGAGDRVVLGAERYELTDGQLTLNFDTVVGVNARTTIIDGNDTSRIAYVPDGASELTNLTVTGGRAGSTSSPLAGDGGAFAVGVDGELRLIGVTLTDNEALVSGGAIANFGDLSFVESTASGNRAGSVEFPGKGGGIFIGTDAGAIQLLNSTISGNTAVTTGGQSFGGGLYAEDNYKSDFVTIADNTAASGGGLWHGDAPATITNTLVAENTGGACAGSVGLLNEDHNLADDGTCDFDDTGDHEVADAKIGALADHGGQTDTHGLLAGSPAIDAADPDTCPATDQRGEPRAAAGPCAIGAFEGVLGQDFTVTTTVDENDGECAIDCTLREALELAGPNDAVILPAGHYVLELDESLPLKGDTVVGTAGARATTIDAQNSERVLSVTEGANEVAGVTITGGRSPSTPTGIGGGVLVQGEDTSLVMSNVTITDNEASEGGGIANVGATLDLIRSTVSGNHVQASGGGRGGGLYLTGGLTRVTNATISDNVASDPEAPVATGGAIHVLGGSLSTRNVTIADNAADEGDAIFVSGLASATVTLTNTIAAGTCSGGPLTGDHNVVSSSTCGAAPKSPQLLPLANNGGQTNTRALKAASPAIDAAVNCESTDQRGETRRRACDAGSYEYTGTLPSGPPSGPPPPPPDDGELPPPVPHKNVNALPKSGTVKVKFPGTSTFVLLDEDTQIPLGTTVDVRKGRVTIVAAAGSGQTADFYGGIFKLSQTKGSKPITVLTLVEKLTCAKKSDASTAAKKKRKRRLWGNGKGRFRTKGKRSAATVVGTRWLVEDRCTSTLTKVVRGKVRVRDFVKKKTVIVKAGKKYVARARR